MAERARRKLAFDNAGFDLDGNFKLALPRMKMGRRVVIPEHGNDDAEKSADDGHGQFSPCRAAASTRCSLTRVSHGQRGHRDSGSLPLRAFGKLQAESLAQLIRRYAALIDEEAASRPP